MLRRTELGLGWTDIGHETKGGQAKRVASAPRTLCTGSAATHGATDGHLAAAAAATACRPVEERLQNVPHPPAVAEFLLLARSRAPAGSTVRAELQRNPAFDISLGLEAAINPGQGIRVLSLDVTGEDCESSNFGSSFLVV